MEDVGRGTQARLAGKAEGGWFIHEEESALCASIKGREAKTIRH
jgi:NADH:ubiquinone oxidoreductase subunit F (NADH-binding)